MQAAMEAFVRRFFQALGAPAAPAGPGVWEVELAPEQRNLIGPVPTLPWWAAPPVPQEPVRWRVAFTEEAAEAHPGAKLLTPHSQLFHQLEATCRRLGMVYTGTLETPGAARYRPYLWLHVSVSRRSRREVRSRLDAWCCDLATGRLERHAPPPLARLAPGPPPAGTTVERIRVTPLGVWEAVVAATVAREGAAGTGWAEAALPSLKEEQREIEGYYAALLEGADAETARALQAERERRLEEARGRHTPRLVVEPVALLLAYLPADPGAPG